MNKSPTNVCFQFHPLIDPNPPPSPSTLPTHTRKHAHTPHSSLSLSVSLSLSMESSIPKYCCTRTVVLVALLLSLMTPGSRALVGLEFRPAAAEPRVVEQPPRDGAWRRRLAPFQLCLACKCCAAASPTPVCATMPCCFGIDCQLPNKPFGVCAFVPKSCNCTSCAV